jgi:hypothetical protein
MVQSITFVIEIPGRHHYYVRNPPRDHTQPRTSAAYAFRPYHHSLLLRFSECPSNRGNPCGLCSRWKGPRLVTGAKLLHLLGTVDLGVYLASLVPKPTPLLCVVGRSLRNGAQKRSLRKERRNNRLRLPIITRSVRVTIRKGT